MSLIESNRLKKSYDQTMQDMRHELSPRGRTLSQLIHTPILAPLLSILSRTLLRPRSLIIGGTVAGITLIATALLTYLYTYIPSGLEPHLGFLTGWTIGIVYDLVISIRQKIRRQR